MSLQPLITGQTIKIDNHHRGKPIDWEKDDVHIHKETNSGERQEFTIKLSINSNKKYTVMDKHNTHEIPNRIRKEIEKALENAKTREQFIRDLLDWLKNSSQQDIGEKAEETLERLAKHFKLHWTNEEIKRYIDGALVSLTRVYKNEHEKEFYMKIIKQRNSKEATLEIGENSGRAKETNRIGR
jgi:hypothetical protein